MEIDRKKVFPGHYVPAIHETAPSGARWKDRGPNPG